MDTYDNCIDTWSVVLRFEALLKFLNLDSGSALVGAIKLNNEEIVLATQPLQTKLKIHDGAWFWFWITVTFAQFISDCNEMFYLKMWSFWFGGS